MDLHRHDEFSTFDGYGKATELAKLAKEYGYTALGISNHGNTNGLVQHYLACKDQGIKPVLGVEGYFLPVYKPQTRGYHLCLFSATATGYRNINTIQYQGEKVKYYNPVWTFEMLEKHSEGVICTSACIAGYLAQSVKEGNMDKATKFVKKMVSIFGDNFYIEIQPYKISEPGLQERVNVGLIEIAEELNVKCIFTSDSHRGDKEDFDTYLKMHEIAKHDLSHIEETYKERYMPKKMEMAKRFVKMHSGDFGVEEAKRMAIQFEKNLKELEDKVEEDIFSGLKETLPKFSDNSNELLEKKIKDKLRREGKYTKKYIKRAKEELEVIKELGFQDYFLIVADYIQFARDNDIAVGPGRGSACNSLVAYSLDITSVDPILFDLDFRRFLRKDKKKMPDIDMDFEKERRLEVIQYVVNKYKGKTARIASYGLYKVDNLINDLAKVCGLDSTNNSNDVALMGKEEVKKEIASIKSVINTFIDEEGNLDKVGLLSSRSAIEFNRKYDNIIKHFSKLYKKMRFIGTHAAGVAVTGGNILDYTSLRIDKNGDLFTNYDLNDMENINVIKFDMLGLRTMESLHELRKLTGCDDFQRKMIEDAVKDPDVLEAFNKGETDGVFQFDKKAVKTILQKIDCNCFDDVVAANAMNRPGPLSLKMPEHYAENKYNLELSQNAPYYEYTKESYGTIIYQEQIQQICVHIGKMTWGDADKVMKMIGGQSQSEDAKIIFEKNKKELGDKFIKGAMENGLTKKQAKEIWDMVLVYSFNKGHSVGYSLVSIEEMYYKVHFPLEYWYSKIKYALNDEEYRKFCEKASVEGIVIFLPHINLSTERARIRKVEGEKCIQLGLSEIKGIGEKAANEIVMERKRNGVFTSFDDFYDRCKSRAVTSGVIKTMQSHGAVIELDKKMYLKRVTASNRALYSRGLTYKDK